MTKSQALSTEEIFNFMELLNSVEKEPEVDTFRKAALHYLMDVFKSTYAFFFLIDATDKSINLDTGIAYGIDFDSIRNQYNQHFKKMDPFQQQPLEKLGVSLLSDMVSEKSFMKGEFYNEFLKQQDMLHAMNIPLAANGDCIGAVALCRSAHESNFTSQDKSKVRKLLPYLDSALRRSMISEHAHELGWLLSASLQELDKVGVVLLDRDLHEVYSNGVARHLLSDFDSSDSTANNPVAGGRITLPEPLISLCQQHFQVTYADDGAGDEISSLIINSTRASIRVKIKKISGRFCGEQKQYLCVNIDTGDETALQISSSRAAGFGLTTREIEVVQAIAKGISNMQIAEDLFISCNTVKNHLKNIFSKVGVRNRMELLTTLLIRH